MRAGEAEVGKLEPESCVAGGRVSSPLGLSARSLLTLQGGSPRQWTPKEERSARTCPVAPLPHGLLIVSLIIAA